MGATKLLGRTRRIFGVMVVLAFSALVMVGCGKDDDDDSGGGGGGSGISADSWKGKTIPGTEYSDIADATAVVSADGKTIELVVNGTTVSTGTIGTAQDMSNASTGAKNYLAKITVDGAEVGEIKVNKSGFGTFIGVTFKYEGEYFYGNLDL